MTAFLYATVVLCWSFTWYAIKLQLGDVPPEVSILWRFVVAAAVMWAGLALTGRLRPAPWRQHLWFAALGLTQLGLNFVMMYEATGFIASGVVSVVFTLVTVFNAVNHWVFNGKAPTLRMIAGAVLGIAGVALLFGQALGTLDNDARTATGIALALTGTLVFSFGNFVTPRAVAGLDLPNAIVRGMTWGAALLFALVMARGQPLVIATTPVYLGSLLYLALFGSVAAFLAYTSLLARIGPARTAYATVLFPVLALAISTMLEGYAWTPWAFAGLPLILLGNVVIFTGQNRRLTA
jgi:drug/metabolite transporter (DMT)-like permease